MAFWVQVVLLVLAIPVLTSMLVLVVELLLALLPRSPRPLPQGEARPGCAVLIPAHNEQAGIAATIKSVQAQLAPGDRILVVADNCQDATAQTAREAGAQVVERFDTQRRGKGYALDFGVRELEKDPPGVVVIVDADCQLQPGTIEHLARQALATGCPSQAAYSMTAPPEAGAKAQLSAFTFHVKNISRPAGLARLGGPCLLTGTGMGFPWELIRTAPLATGNLVEDMQLGIDLALAGRAPRFCPDAHVVSELPVGEEAARKQGTRWVHGHLTTILTQAPRLLAAGRVALALELSVLPQTLLFLLWFVLAVGISLCWALGGALWPVLLMLAVWAALALALFLVWLRDGRQMLPPGSLVQLPGFVIRRLFIFVLYLGRRATGWTDRTARKGEGTNA